MPEAGFFILSKYDYRNKKTEQLCVRLGFKGTSKKSIEKKNKRQREREIVLIVPVCCILTRTFGFFCLISLVVIVL